MSLFNLENIWCFRKHGIWNGFGRAHNFCILMQVNDFSRFWCDSSSIGFFALLSTCAREWITENSAMLSTAGENGQINAFFFWHWDILLRHYRLIMIVRRESTQGDMRYLSSIGSLNCLRRSMSPDSQLHRMHVNPRARRVAFHQKVILLDSMSVM
jgi:hypothetical protein